MPKVVDHAERRAELADAALRLIATNGIAAVTTRGVANESGWSTGVINHYFRSRHDLLVGALRRAAEVQGRQFKELRSSSSPDPLTRLAQVLESVLPIDERRVALTRIFLEFYSEAAVNEDAREEVADYLSNWRRVVQRMIVTAQGAGQLPQGLDAEAEAQRLVALADGLAIHALLDDEVMKRVRSGDGVAAEWLVPVVQSATGPAATLS